MKVFFLTLVVTVFVLAGLLSLNFLPEALGLSPGAGFSEKAIRSYAVRYLQSEPGSNVLEYVPEKVEIQKMNLHNSLFWVAKVAVRLRGEFDTSGMLYLVSAPDDSTYLIGKADLFSQVDRRGYNAVAEGLN